MRQLLWILFVCIHCLVWAQPTKKQVLEKFGFEEHLISTGSDTIYLYVKGGPQASKIVLHLQGSTAAPLFTFALEKDGYKSYRWFPSDYKRLDSTYAYAIIAKKGMHGVMNESNLTPPAIYHQVNSLDYRVFQAREALKFLGEHIVSNPEQVIVYGHSEGAPVAAKLGTISDRITHLGFWAGGVLNEYYDFMIMDLNQYQKGKLTAEAFSNSVQSSITEVEKLRADSLGTKVSGGYTNKRWWSYSEPPLNHLLAIDIPLHTVFATDDESSPFESAMILPLEFARQGKSNLSFNVCAGCDHGFVKKVKKKEVDQWETIFKDFLLWSQRN